jgi:hypothetical protein
LRKNQICVRSLTLPSGQGSYVAVRVVSRATPAAWWDSARTTSDKPAAIVALLNGRNRVEVSPGDAAATIAWAGRLVGWTEADPKPIAVHSPLS